MTDYSGVDAIRAKLEEYELPTEEGPTRLDRLRMYAANVERHHPELKWRIWKHPNPAPEWTTSDDWFWLDLGYFATGVTYVEANNHLRLMDQAIYAFKRAIQAGAVSHELV